ncbi:hypothetical protein EDB86DRAFT_2894259, partial [Lactarius hatsudake]
MARFLYGVTFVIYFICSKLAKKLNTAASRCSKFHPKIVHHPPSAVLCSVLNSFTGEQLIRTALYFPIPVAKPAAV